MAVYKYKIVESIIPPDEEDKFDEYIFVVRTRVGKHPSLHVGHRLLTTRTR